MRLVLCLIAVGLVVCGCGGGGGGSDLGGGEQPPTISALSPASATAGGAALTLTVNGGNFVSSSVVEWNGAALTTTYTSATQLMAQVPASDIATAGTAQVTVLNSAADGGASAAVSFNIGTQGAGPKLVQFNSYQTTSNNTEGNSTVQFNAATKAGDTIWVAVTVSDFAGVHSISVIDSQNNSYTLLDQENDGAPGSQTVAHFYASNIAGDTAAPDIVTINWTEDDYKGILVAEISGTTQTTVVGHHDNIQDGLGVAANAVTSGPINVSAAETPALLVALSMDTSGGTSDTGGSGFAGPTAGSGMTPVTMLWNYGANLATFVTANVTSAESISATFTPLDTDSYVTVAAVFH